MYGLHFREQLPAVVANEFDGLIAAVRAFIYKEHNEDGTHRVTVEPQTIPIGAISMWGTNTAPTGWLLCDGSQVSRVQYKSLFDVIGTTFGAGDGSLTFNLPDFRQRFPLGKAASGTGATLAGTGGNIDHTHSGGTISGSTGSTSVSISGSTSTDGSHTHTIGSIDVSPVEGVGGSGTLVIDVDENTGSSGSHNHDSGTLAGASHSHAAGTLAIAATGTGNPPFLAVNYIINAGK